ncbi:unnamed protein product [Candida verbasci]|uniref:RRM domain-containing protein n=1 Tax=Candida verbasci TaxID=1227364 RepID=A0A9W4TW66_9ASCO|nr:unnamed protein product [Candida verbasci]
MPSYQGNRNKDHYNSKSFRSNNNRNAGGAPRSYRPSSSSYKARQNLYQQHSISHNKADQLQLWMGDIDSQWNEEFLMRLWTDLVTKPVSVKIIRDKANPSKSAYSFITFQSQESIDLALQRNGQKIPHSNKTFKLNHASGGKSQSGSHDQTTENTLFVGDIALEVNEATLFSKFNLKYPNQIQSAKIILDINTKKSRGFGFIKFSNGDVMLKALDEMQGMIIGSKAIRLGIAAGSETTNTTSQKETKIDYHKIPIAQHQPELNKWTDQNNTSMLISGLNTKFTIREIENLLLGFGNVIYVELAQDFDKCYVKFLNRHEAEQAFLYLHGSVINECRLKVSWGVSVPVKDGAVKFKPKLVNEGKYEKNIDVPSIFITNEYVNKRLDIINESVRGSLFKLDGSEPKSIIEINDLYFNKKLNQFEILNDSLY